MHHCEKNLLMHCGPEQEQPLSNQTPGISKNHKRNLLQKDSLGKNFRKGDFYTFSPSETLCNLYQIKPQNH